jgi:hypothetical protein
MIARMCRIALGMTLLAAIGCSQAQPPRVDAGGSPGPKGGSPQRAKAVMSSDVQSEVTGYLVVLRGLKIGIKYPLYTGDNYIGRADEMPVDIDLDDQEPPDRVWSSRQHALLKCMDGKFVIEDLNSANGTFVNRKRVVPGTKANLQFNDVIQIGTVQMKLVPAEKK